MNLFALTDQLIIANCSILIFGLKYAKLDKMKKLSNNTSGQALLTDCEIGQALLMVLLSMSVVLTIVLSILARSTLDIGVSTRSEESVRAFSAAEAGIEQALVAGPLSGTLANDATFDARVTDFSSGSSEFILPSSLYSGESATVWFVSHDADGDLSCAGSDNPCFTGSQIQVCWGKEGTSANSSTTPAIEVSIVYLTSAGNYTTARIAREVADPNSSRRSSNSFSATDSGTCEVNGQTFAFKKTVDFGNAGLKILPASVYIQPNGLQLARIASLYNTDMGHPVSVKVSSGSTLPAQGVVIDSSGVSGDSTRRVEVIRGFKELPGIFENVVFSQESVSKSL